MKMNFYFLVGFLWLGFGLFAQADVAPENEEHAQAAQGEALEVYESFEAFAKTYLDDAPTDRVRVINLWATWCSPCLKELP